MNVATGGFGTEITAQTDSGLKDKLGGAAYLITGMSPCLYHSMWHWCAHYLCKK